MTPRKIITLLLLTLSFSANSIKLEYKFKKDTKFNITAKIYGIKVKKDITEIQGDNYYFSNEDKTSYSQEYKTTRIVKSFDNNIAKINDQYYYFIKDENQLSNITDTVEVEYSKNTTGELTINERSAFPTFRNAPYFPDKNINPGDTWEFDAVEVQNLFNDGALSYYPLKIKYTYLKNDESNDNIAIIQYNYDFDIKVSETSMIDKRLSRVAGQGEITLHFDRVNGKNMKESYKSHYQVVVGNTPYFMYLVEFIHGGERRWNEVEKQLDTKKAETDIKEKTKNLKDIEIEKTDKGIKISIANLKFKANEANLLPGEEKRLLDLAAVLKDYKDKTIIITGHTSHVGQSEARKKLSTKRAKVITEKLIELDSVDKDKTFYYGKGSEEPIADNSTFEGRQKNRRVEIMIQD